MGERKNKNDYLDVFYVLPKVYLICAMDTSDAVVFNGFYVGFLYLVGRRILRSSNEEELHGSSNEEVISSNRIKDRITLLGQRTEVKVLVLVQEKNFHFYIRTNI